MRINAVPIGDRSLGSSRIRCYRLLEFLPDGFEVSFSPSLECDVLFIQKVARRSEVSLAKEARRAGVAVIYDIDDDFGVWPGMMENEMCDVADVVLTDSSQRQEWVQSKTKTSVCLVPAAIDYMNERPGPLQNEKCGSLVTFGNNHALRQAAPYLSKIDCQKAQIGAERIAEVPLIPWSLNGFIPSLREFDVCFLAHNKQDGLRKSENRLVTAMAAGLPCLVSDTPSYRKVMESCGFADLLVGSPDSMERCYANLMRQYDEVAKRMQDYAWEHYHPRNASQFLEKIIFTLRGK